MIKLRLCKKILEYLWSPEGWAVERRIRILWSTVINIEGEFLSNDLPNNYLIIDIKASSTQKSKNRMTTRVFFSLQNNYLNINSITFHV